MSYQRSRYTMAEPWDDGRGLLVNLLTGAADIVPHPLIHFVRTHLHMKSDEPTAPLHELLLERGYYVDSPDIEEAFARAVLIKAKAKAQQEAQPKYMFGLGLRCNLSCPYCWQENEHRSSRQDSPLMGPEQVEAAFSYIDRDLVSRPRKDAFISLFGGEPLMDDAEHRTVVQRIGDHALDRGMHLHFTTNGKELDRYRSEIDRYRPSIQVTIDDVYLNGGVVLMRTGQMLKGLYELLADLAHEGTGTIFLRFLVQNDTAKAFVTLADMAFQDPRLQKSFTLAVAPLQNKTEHRNPEIPAKVNLLPALMQQLQDRPYSHRITFTDWRGLNLLTALRQGRNELPWPMFFHCEANLHLTCFDQDGSLYACYEAMGNPRLAIGTYWPQVTHYPERVAAYRERSAFSIPQCVRCPLSPLCGGGCEVRGFKKYGGTLHPNCAGIHDEVHYVMRHWASLLKLLSGSPNVE